MFKGACVLRCLYVFRRLVWLFVCCLVFFGICLRCFGVHCGDTLQLSGWKFDFPVFILMRVVGG